MTLPILHHYPTSPWAELVRLGLGLKGLDWGSVIIPVTCPKPALEVLTGGYVRTPVLQVGADIHCDTLAIMAALEALQPEPTFHPAPLGQDHRALAQEAGGATFFAAVGAALGDLPGEGNEAFWADRERRFGLRPEQFRAMVPALRQAFAAHLARLDSQLSDGRAFLGGEAPGHADLAHAMLLWFAARDGAGVTPRLAAWQARVEALGHGRPRPMTAEDAIAMARASTPAPLHRGVAPGSGLAAGQRVAVSQEGSFDPPVIATLVALDAEGIVLHRHDPRAGDLHVHFPRAGQRIAAA